MSNSDPGGQIFLSAPNNHDRFFFLHTFLSPVFDFNVQVAINESRSYTLTSAILEVDIVCDVAMTSTSNILMTDLCDLLYNQCIDNTCCCSIYIYLTHWIRVCKIRFVSARKNCGKPCLVCKKKNFFHGCEVHTEKSVPLHHYLASLGKPYNAEQWPSGLINIPYSRNYRMKNNEVFWFFSGWTI